MFVKPRTVLATLAVIVRAAWPCQGAEASGEWPAVHSYSPSAALVEIAGNRGVELGGITLAAPGAGVTPSDTLVLLVVLDEQTSQTQWLVQLRGPRPVEAKHDASKPIRETVVYALDGRAIRFPRREENYTILALGPYHSGRPAESVPAREIKVTMNAAFLDESFLDAAAFMFLAGRARHEGRLREDELFTVFPRPPAKPDPALRERFVAEAGLTDKNERAVAASVPSLTEFARVIAETPGLREVLFAVVDKPSVWSVIQRFGRIETGFRFRSGEVTPSMGPPKGFAGIGRSYVVPFGFSINDRPALDCTILVTEPRPPLRTCGGIVALVASTPARDDVRLIVRVIGALPGAPKSP